MLGAVGDTSSPDYRLFRTEGYVLPPKADDTSEGDREGFGIGRAFVGAQRGVPVEGYRPLLVIQGEFADVRMRHTPAQVREVFDGTPDQSIAGYFREMSRGVFEWERATIVGPYTSPDQQGTDPDESLYNCALIVATDHDGNAATPDKPICEGAAGDWERVIGWMLRAADRDVDFSRFDTAPRDGRVDSHELGVVLVGANPPLDGRDRTRYPVSSADGGATRYPGNWGGCVRADGVEVCTAVSSVGESASTATIAHEMVHLLESGVDNDLYGSFRFGSESGSFGASLMAATILSREDAQMRVHLDPWHKMRLGWAEPVVRPIHPAVPPAGASLTFPSTASHLSPLYQPILLYDPRRGAGESFLFEHRRPAGFDATLNGGAGGVAVWYARTLSDCPSGKASPCLYEAARDLSSDGVLWWRADAVGHSLWIVGASSQQRGLPTFWAAAHHEVALDWYPDAPTTVRIDSTSWRFVRGAPDPPVLDGSLDRSAGPRGAEFGPGPFRRMPDPEPSGLVFRVGNHRWNPGDRDPIDIEWKTNDMPFLGRIDRVEDGGIHFLRVREGEGDSVVRRLILRGEFGVSGYKTVAVEPESGGAPLQSMVHRWSSELIEVDVFADRSNRTVDVPGGRYTVRVYTDATRSQGGNAHEVVVTHQDREGPH